MEDKAKQRALEKYPKKIEWVGNQWDGAPFDINSKSRVAYKEGYHQAEKDLELTNEDVYDIWRIYNEVCAEGEINGFDETSQEVLKRFKETKKWTTYLTAKGI